MRASTVTSLTAQDNIASVLCIYLKTIPAKQAKVYFVYFVNQNSQPTTDASSTNRFAESGHT